MFSQKQLEDIFKRMADVGSAFWYKGSSANFDNGEKHPFVIVFLDKKTGKLFAVNGSSQIERSKRRAEIRNYKPDTLVFLKEGSYDFITKETVIDCNSLHTNFNLEKLVGDNNFNPIHQKINEEDLQKILDGILKSNVIYENIKQKIRKGIK